MQNSVEQRPTSILAGVRDNLLKPMAAEIEGLQRDNQDAILKCFSEQTRILSEQMSSLKNDVANLQEQLKHMAEEIRAKTEKQIKSLRKLLWWGIGIAVLSVLANIALIIAVVKCR